MYYLDYRRLSSAVIRSKLTTDQIGKTSQVMTVISVSCDKSRSFSVSQSLLPEENGTSLIHGGVELQYFYQAS